jgi:V/A-type H+/Na+-transporting ATPase subunit K
MIVIVAVFAGLLPMIPAVIYFLKLRKSEPALASRKLVNGLMGVNAMIGLMAIGLAVVWLASPSAALAAGPFQAAVRDPYASLAAGIATGLATVGAGIAVSGTGAAAIGAIAEKPEFIGRAFIFVGLAEGIAIYGLIIAFIVLNR